MSHNSDYRADIDGLRAVAVIPVVLFHAGFGFEGGFVGVDVFFVISGFLITGVILKETDKNNFKLSQFWIRRILRIVPAVTVMALVTILLALYVLDPQSLKDFGRQLQSQTLMIANFHFWRDAGYFAEAAERKLLLHTWSLSVEEQFYLGFPLFLILLKNRKNLLFGLLVLGALLSLALNIVVSHALLLDEGIPGSSRAAFFLLPARAWELLTGSILAIIVRTKGESLLPKVPPFLAQLCAATGLILLFSSYFFLTEDLPFPGIYALPPVIGTALIIFGCDKRVGNGLVTKILSCKPLVIIGLMSYSLYLWHWPLMVFVKYLWADPTAFHYFWAVILSVIFAFLSWHFVEKPFRRPYFRNRPGRVFASTAVLLLLGVFGARIFVESNGIPSRFSDYHRTLGNDAHGRYPSQKKQSVTPKAESFGVVRPLGVDTLSGTDDWDFAVLGDSHALALLSSFDEAAKETNTRGLAICRTGFIYLPDIWLVQGDSPKKAQLERIKSIYSYLAEQGVDFVFLAQRWSAYYEAKENIQNPNLFAYANEDPNDNSASFERNLSVLEYGFNSLNLKFRRRDMQLSVLEQVPEVGVRGEFTGHRFLAYKRFPQLNSNFEQFRISREDFRAQSDPFRQLFLQDKSNIQLLRFEDSFFEGKSSFNVYGEERSFFSDENHLTRKGAQKYVYPVIKDHLLKISVRKKSSSSK